MLESSSRTISHEIKMNSKLTYKNIEIDGRWKDSAGEYGINNCYGNIKSKDSVIELEAFCKKVDSTGDKAWFSIKRNSAMDAGVGVSTYISATGKYTKLIGIKCTYAVKYYDKEYNFYIHKCKLN